MTLRHRGYITESKEIHVGLNELPSALQKALKKVGYRRRDVRVYSATETTIGPPSFEGSRGFAMAVNLKTGQMSDIQYGSWGGPNPFEKKPVDHQRKPVRIAANGAIITGEVGGRGVFASIYVHPDSLAPLLPGGNDVTEREREILAMACYKSFYKKELFERHRVTKDEILNLVKRGYMKMNKAGATSVTPKGKNERSNKYY